MRSLLAMAVLALAWPACAQLGNFNFNKALDFGKKALENKEAFKEFTEEDEIQIGQAATAGFLGAAPLHPDASLQRYVNRVGKWLAIHSDRPDLPWTFSVMDTETINAFALPGGSILVSHGLLKRLNSEAELAGVLAHEIAHVVKKHQIAAIQSAARANFGKLIGTEIANEKWRGGGAAVQTIKPLAVNLAADLFKDGFFLRPLDRGLEYDADQLAVVIATRSGYDPYGLVGAMQMLAQYKGDSDGASVFATHPAPSERLAELEKFMPAIEQHARQPQLLEARYKQNVK